MNNLLKKTIKLLLVCLLLALAACGGGGGDTQTQDQAAITLTLNGGSDTIGSLDFDLILPAGFSLATDGSGELAVDVVTSTLPSDSMVKANYLPEDALNRWQLSVAVIRSGGFAAGASLTLVHDLTDDEALPLDTAFTVGNLLVTDLNGVELSGYSLDISVKRQTLTF